MSRIFSYQKVKAENVEMEGAHGVKVRWLITKVIGASNFAMRIFEIESEGYTPLHNHPWEHEIFILQGTGQLLDGKDTSEFKVGDVVFVPPNEMHQFRNNGRSLLTFICLIPYKKSE